MEALFHAIDTTPIIDHHAHNLLLPDELEAHQFLAITTEANDGALRHTQSTVSHIRAVKQLSDILGCDPDWESVQAAIAEKRNEPDQAWAKRCFEGIETALIDDGLDENIVHPWDWHHQLTRSKCKRIVRIEKVAENILKNYLKKRRSQDAPPPLDYAIVLENWQRHFKAAIKEAIQDRNVVGFKSVICYRTGLAVPGFYPDPSRLKAALRRILSSEFTRLEDEDFSPHFVHLTAQLISESEEHPKPFQFHTGLGDNDITLSLASPSHLQPFIKTYPKVPVVLLHASYPFTKEAGYLASAYENVYLDIGEVFPMVSQEGQENIIRESLELCPSEKLFWSTDGHWFPETYLLAVIQVREAMKQVLSNSISRNSLEVAQAVKIVEDVFFNTSNIIYNLGLTLTPLGPPPLVERPSNDMKQKNLTIFIQFLNKYPSIKYLRLQWLDYTATQRLRVIPIRLAVNMFTSFKSITITRAVFALLQHDSMVPGIAGPVGEYELVPCFDGLRLGAHDGYATVQGEFREGGGDLELCPRTLLRQVVEKGKVNGISFLVGFELEVVLMSTDINEGSHVYGKVPLGHAHAWSNASAMRNPKIMTVIEEILETLEKCQIDLQQFHPENAPGQYEFVTGPLPPLESVDTLMATREIVYTIAERHSLKATFVPKPYPMACGTGAHVHMSMTPEEKHTSFYAGVLKHLRAIAAFTYCNKASYDRMLDSVWSGGRFVAWGTQNRETPLRKIENSHWEFKCMDGLANPYLAMAAILGAGLEGVLDKLPLTMHDCTDDPALLAIETRKKLGIEKQLPKSFPEALDCLKQDVEMRKILGAKFVGTYCAVKKHEMEMLDAMESDERMRFLIEHY